VGLKLLHLHLVFTDVDCVKSTDEEEVFDKDNEYLEMIAKVRMDSKSV
jgi:hypothetical protein